MDDFFGEFDEFNDQDATDCANGDYNQFEEQQVFLDNEGGDFDGDDDLDGDDEQQGRADDFDELDKAQWASDRFHDQRDNDYVWGDE